MRTQVIVIRQALKGIVADWRSAMHSSGRFPPFRLTFHFHLGENFTA